MHIHSYSCANLVLYAQVSNDMLYYHAMSQGNLVDWIIAVNVQFPIYKVIGHAAKANFPSWIKLEETKKEIQHAYLRVLTINVYIKKLFSVSTKSFGTSKQSRENHYNVRDQRCWSWRTIDYDNYDKINWEWLKDICD